MHYFGTRLKQPCLIHGREEAGRSHWRLTDAAGAAQQLRTFEKTPGLGTFNLKKASVVRQEFEDFLRCGRLELGFWRQTHGRERGAAGGRGVAGRSHPPVGTEFPLSTEPAAGPTT